MNVEGDQPGVLLDNWDNEIDIDPPFIGREHDLRLLQKAFHQYRVFGVFGIRSVGKSRLVKEFLNRISDSCECKKSSSSPRREKEITNRPPAYKMANSKGCWSCDIVPTIIRLDLEQQTDTGSVYSNLCACIEETFEVSNTKNKTWILHIVKYVKDRRGQQFIFFFDNAEHVEDNSELADDLKSLFWQLTSTCVNVRLFITSTTLFMTSMPNRVYFTHELLPLRPTESMELLKIIAPEVDLGEYRDVIVKLSEGIPLLLSMIANELADDQGLITPKDMAELLATSRLKCLSRREFYAKEDCIADIYKKFINRLHVIYQRRLSILGYIPGSFDVREARELLGFDTDAQANDQALVPIRRRYMLTYDPETKRFNIQGILRECLDVFFAIRNITDVRKKFCSVFSNVMTEIAEDLGTAETSRALFKFSLEQPNLQKLMTEVFHSTEETYRFFITMATKCTDLIERFLLKECDKFYDGCLMMAGRYGNDVDTAVVSIAVGSMWTNAKGDLRQGEKYYRKALKVLVPNGNSLHQATIYQQLGWNLQSQGQSAEAVRYFRESLNICQRGGPEFHRLHHLSLTCLGIACTVLGLSNETENRALLDQLYPRGSIKNHTVEADGNYQDAENYHFMSLRRAEAMLNDDHPELGFIYNSLGVLYNELGESETALKYYLKGLENKKRNNAHENSLILSYSNVASQYKRLKKYDEAINMLDESLELALQRDPPLQTVVALIYDTKGKVFMAQNKYSEAMTMFGKAVEIRDSLIPDHIIYVESLLHLADSLRLLGKYESSIETARKALKLKTKATERMPPNTFIAECYQCLADVYKRIGNDKKYLQTLTSLETELLRLEDVHRWACNENKLTWVRKQLAGLKDKQERFMRCKLKEVIENTDA